MAEREARILAKELAALYAVEYRTVQNWVAAGCPHRKRSRRLEFLLSEVVPWRRDQDKRESRGGDAPDLAQEQARKTRADADLSELKVQKMRGSLIAASDVEHEMERLCNVLRARVLSVRGRWAPKVLGLTSMAEATSTLDALANDVLDALRGGADDLEESDEEDEEEAKDEEEAA